MLRCGLCDAAFVLSNGTRYQCSSHVNGGACSNRLSVRRSLVETKVIDTVQADLTDPEFIAEFERSLRRAASKPKAPADNRQRIGQLRKEVQNLTDAIAKGLLRKSPALAARLVEAAEAAEEELQRLEAATQPPKVRTLAPNVREVCLGIVRRLQATIQNQDPDRARAALMDAIGPQIVLDPDQSGRFLWADFGLEPTPLRAAVGESEIMVAGAGFEPATFGL
ncbi:MAG: recombinase zinc beta ribbon domain-containing protein [Sinobacteraceae bacterium]|nr:recombinase zinc beta ribbon domain-containing protein [Nevskiaceae bacterium]MCP5467030.1 recombinase zinc beta ribbon domain-containing protein [Nevskiaceae bacterium]MCP5472305.1 recombinase zinc beta ribbon domain-containing protein [Nevskiaceae bacterium]